MGLVQPPPIHLHHITPSGLRALLARSGFQLETLVLLRPLGRKPYR